jgi:hypothetical protein
MTSSRRAQQLASSCRPPYQSLSARSWGQQQSARELCRCPDAAKRSQTNGDELNQVNNIVRGTVTGNLLRKVSNVLGAGGGRLGQSLAMAAGGYAGSQADGPEGAAAGAVLPLLAGAAARRFANGVTARQVSKLDQMVRSRSPLAGNGGMTRGQQVRASLAQLGNTARALIAMRAGQQQQ